MLQNSLSSVLMPRAMLFAGLACGVVLVSRNIVEVNKAGRALAAQEQEYRRQIIPYEQCAAAVKRSDNGGALLELVIDAECPPKPLDPVAYFAQYKSKSRATALELAGMVLVLASLPWFASRWMRARITQPPIRA